MTGRTSTRPGAAIFRGGAGPGGARTMYVLGLLSGVKAIALVVLADSLARGIVAVIAGDPVDGPLTLALAAAAARALAGWATQAYAARASIGAKERIRADLADRLVLDGRGHVGAMTTLATRGLDELDKYYAVVLPAITNVAVVPLVVGLRILTADWLSAVIVVVTVPLIPVFMALIGMETQEKVTAASASLARLSDHLVELARGLPVLVGLGRVEEQTVALGRISDDYRSRTMQTLRSAFMSSLALELISTISVAVVAVFIGTRLVAGTLPLEVGLLVLILAPECFAPFRDLGAAFHASQDGLLALTDAREIIDAPGAPAVATAAAVVSVSGLAVHYRDRPTAAVEDVSFVLPTGEITALRGASGSGKSTILAVLAGIVRDGCEGATVTGRVSGLLGRGIAWVPQHPHTVGDTVLEEMRLYAAEPDTAAGLARIVALLERFGLAGFADADPARLSPGELRRLAFARALLRVDAGARLVLLDEPTAHLDTESARAIESTIAGLRGKATVVLASHEESVSSLAAHVVQLGSPAAVAAPVTISPSPAGHDAATVALVTGNAAPVPLRRVVSLLREIIAPARWRFALAILLGVLAALFAISLTAVSGWLIVKASSQPPIMYLLVAIVGVRFFGIGRSVLRYVERLMTHDAIFVSVTRLRTRLWRTLARRGASSRSLTRGGTALDYLVFTADQIRDLAPRVLVPPLVGAACSIAAAVAFWVLHAPAVPLLVACILVSLLVGPLVALIADRAASRGQLLIRGIVGRRFAAMIAAAVELRANGVDGRVRADLRDLDARAGETARRSAGALGLGGAIVIGASWATSALMLVVSAPAVADGSLSPELVAVLVLVPLGLLDPLLAVVDAIQQWPSFLQSLRRIAGLTEGADLAPGHGVLESPVGELELRDVSVCWPDAAAPAVDHANAHARTGDWLVVTGASGSGKSTVLTALLGYLPVVSGSYRLAGRDTRELDPTQMRTHLAWCPQEGHLFDSTIRANLLIARPRDDAPGDAEMTAVLGDAGLTSLMGSLPLGLDTRIGSEGAELSGGERQRLAVARTLLSRAEIVLLDEPTAHLDPETAASLMADLRRALEGRITVLVTHHVVDEREGDVRLDLDLLAREQSGPSGPLLDSLDAVGARGSLG